MTSIIAYTDGSYDRKTDKGGFGVCLIENNQEKHICKGYSYTTISRMEMRAVLSAIVHFPKKETGELTIYSDSQFIVNSFNKGWLKIWQLQGFVDRPNTDLWLRIIKELELRPNMRFTIIHTRGHRNDIENEIAYYNNVADILANYKNFEKYDIDVK